MANPLKLLVVLDTNGVAVESWVPMTDAEYAQAQADAAAAAAAAVVTAAATTATATIKQRAANALAANDAYLSIPTPTTVQAVAQVRTLTLECDGLIRILLNAFTDVSDT